jgi:hypothetical protein
VVRVLSARLSIVNLKDGRVLLGEAIGSLRPTASGIALELAEGEMSRQLSLVVHQAATILSALERSGFGPTRALAWGEIFGYCMGSGSLFDAVSPGTIVSFS